MAVRRWHFVQVFGIPWKHLPRAGRHWRHSSYPASSRGFAGSSTVIVVKSSNCSSVTTRAISECVRELLCTP
jgi:hypothetical protein